MCSPFVKRFQCTPSVWFLYYLVAHQYFERIDAHSWLACSDYRGDVNYFEQDNCFGWARRWDDRGSDLTAPQPKGYHIAVESPDNRAFANDGCDRPLVPGSSSWKDSYSTEFPHAIYEQGQVYCMAWSMQNHATTPEDCTNTQAKSDAAGKDSLYLYISTVNPDADPSQRDFFFRNINEIAGLANSCDPNGSQWSDEDRCQLGLEKHRETRDCKGFQRSPAFCENTGSAMGTGCFLVPDDLPTGHYVGQWYWDTTFFRPTFVQNTAYKSCFDFEVVPSGSTDIRNPELPPGTKGTPTGSLPCVNNVERFEEILQKTISTTNPPTASPPPPSNNDTNNNDSSNSNGTVNNNNCSPLYQRCGGAGWNGPSCCVDGTECIELYEGWPQCLPTNFESQQQEPQTSAPTPSPTQTTCSPLWERCGGENWTGATCCEQGNCIEQHPNWFVCML